MFASLPNAERGKRSKMVIEGHYIVRARFQRGAILASAIGPIAFAGAHCSDPLSYRFKSCLPVCLCNRRRIYLQFTRTGLPCCPSLTPVELSARSLDVDLGATLAGESEMYYLCTPAEAEHGTIHSFRNMYLVKAHDATEAALLKGGFFSGVELIQATQVEARMQQMLGQLPRPSSQGKWHLHLILIADRLPVVLKEADHESATADAEGINNLAVAFAALKHDVAVGV